MSNPALSVLWQNDDLTVLNKPSGLSVLADRQTQENLWIQLRHEIGKPYLVHRLDKGTSGVLLVARNAATQQHLTRAFANRAVDKYYLCWVVGAVAQGHSLHIQLPLCRGRKSRYRVAAPRDQIVQQHHTYLAQADRDHVTALTHVRCLTHYQGRSLLLAKPVTGRTHQLRVHLSWIGHPIIGDHLYGRPKDPRQQHPRLLLHCHRLVVPGGRRFTAPPPDDIRAPF